MAHRKYFEDERATDLECCLMSQHAYQIGKKDPTPFPDVLIKNGWEMVCDHCDKTKISGYAGALYKNSSRCQLVVAHRGTNNIRSILEDIGGILLGGKGLGQRNDAFCLVQKAINLLATDFNYSSFHRLTFTGHSLGGFLAELSIFYFHFFQNTSKCKTDKSVFVNAVTFESPSSVQIWEKLQSHIGNFKIPTEDKDIIGYVSYPNVINCFGKPIGTVYFINGIVREPGKKLCLKERFFGPKEEWPIYYTKAVHSIDVLSQWLQKFDGSTDPPKVMFDWPLQTEYLRISKYFDLEPKTGKFVVNENIENLEDERAHPELHFIESNLKYGQDLHLRHFPKPIQDILENYNYRGLNSRLEVLLSDVRIRTASGTQCKYLSCPNILMFRSDFAKTLAELPPDDIFAMKEKWKGENHLEFIWWPNKKPLIDSLFKRKVGNKLLIEELHERLLKDKHRMIAILESADAQKLTAMGGVGKTLTAKWYAHQYENEYDHVIWIDCGEGSLLKSFEDLARDLNIKNRNELTEVHKLATKCFKILSEKKCLWIYDNVERYQGEEGIVDVLPKYHKNFYYLITSRSREWGTKNIGYGKISDLELDIFSKEESLNFLKLQLDEEVSYSEDDLIELCRLLGNLPLALQLAVTALNNGKINLKNYISKTSVEDSQEIVNVKFDDYENKISKNINISLGLISNEEFGECAKNILMIFGYIRPVDISSKFLMRINNYKLIDLENGMNLLEKYSLINKTGKVVEYPYDVGLWNKLFGWDKIEKEMDVFSIHRLLQQVIRHNGQSTERETLRRILGCNGFLELKFVPFTKFADENLQKEFSKIKAELLDQRQLQTFVKEKMFKDAVQLAKFIDHELKSSTTQYNLAICLELNGQLDEAVTILKKAFKTENGKTGHGNTLENIFKYVEQMLLTVTPKRELKLLDIKTKEVNLQIGNALFHFLLLLGKNKEAFQIGRQVCRTDLLIWMLNAAKIQNFYLKVNGDEVELDLGGQRRRIDLKKTSIDMSELNYIDCLQLWNVNVLNWKEAKGNVNTLILNDTPFAEKTGMKISELTIFQSSLDTSCLPPTMQKLSICNTQVFWNTVRNTTSIELPNLKFLILQSLRRMDISFLSHFLSTSIQLLTHIHFDQIKEVNFDFLPINIQEMKITNATFHHTNVIGNDGDIKLDKLILEWFTFDQVKQVLKHLNTNHLVLSSIYINESDDQIVDLVNEEINTIAIGRFYWSENDFSESNLSKCVDKESEFYLFEGGRGMAIAYQEFDKLLRPAWSETRANEITIAAT